MLLAALVIVLPLLFAKMCSELNGMIIQIWGSDTQNVSEALLIEESV